MQISLEPVQTLRCHDALLEAGPMAVVVPGLHSLGAAARPRLASMSKALSRRKSSDFLLEAPPHRHRLKKSITTTTTKRKQPPPPHILSSSPPPPPLPLAPPSTAAAAAAAARRGIKRCRLGSDVEGPNTASVGRKKRRLRSRLITSPLSQPFSQPATHILNREGRPVGDRRFVKMAVMLDSSRRAAHLRATAYLRYSVMNRMRKRMGLAPSCSSCSSSSTLRQGIDTFGRAPWQQPQAVKPSHEAKHSFLEEARRGATPPAPQPEEPIGTLAKAPACRLSKPIALPLPSADADATNDRPAARIDSTTSPEPRPPLAWMYDDVEEDSFAHLHAGDEHLDDDDDDDDGVGVYCNFDAIFAVRATSPDPQVTTPKEDHTYEEYMDELDGISWRIG
ncbi:hypothetical protein M419DRAFT_75124 [Trichoderma reesei RUT C-30]|uniref:Uncharacterized protein n=1 Tax=Hypocrea jecorina (strain ATCC 56765 / BCRC 32924 / NRRL 11460 / Rut C-30) TaxID=1344414 RepID=A0A024SHN8_HYPJR|nr:hypothetical protein M419DRAFT_75124 [Trichoderma reesei RUT C-30]